MRLEELFRQKLESAEVIPSIAAGTKIMSKVAAREFVRFNPARFNAFYLGAILVTGITASILIFGEKENVNASSEKQNVSELSSLNTESASTPAIPEADKVSPDVSKNEKVSSKDLNTEGKSAPVVISGVVESLSRPSIENQPVAKGNIDPANIIDPGISSGNKLQEKLKTNEVVMEVPVLEGCLPLKVLFRNKTEVYDSCRWTFGDGGYSVEKNPSWIFDV